jgi:hypothetical protein
MSITFSKRDTPPTLLERFKNAYYAFRMMAAPDIEAVLKELDGILEKEEDKHAALTEKRTVALDKLQPFEQSLVHSVASMTENWRGFFDQAMLFVDQLDTEDQLTIMRYIFETNRRVVTTLRFQQWMTKHADAILDHITD